MSQLDECSNQYLYITRQSIKSGTNCGYMQHHFKQNANFHLFPKHIVIEIAMTMLHIPSNKFVQQGLILENLYSTPTCLFAN